MTVTRTSKPPPGARVDWGNPVNDGLVSWWLFNEGAGQRASDIAGFAPLGDVNSGMEWRGSLYGGALDFNGSSDHVNVGVVPVTGQALTLVVRAKVDDFGSTDYRYISRATGSAAADHYYMLSGVFNGAQRLRFRLRANGATITLVSTGAVTITAGEWHQAAAVYDGTLVRLFKDGIPLNTASKTGDLNTNPTAETNIGRNPGSNLSFLDGLVDDARIYSRALTSDQLQEIIHNPYGGILVHNGLRYFVPAAAAAEGVGASAGVATVTGVGISTFEAVGSSVGLAAVAGVGAPTFEGVGASAGTATVTGVGISTLEAVGSSAGVAVVTGVGISTFEGVAASVGLATVTGVGISTHEGVGASAGVAVVTGISVDGSVGASVGLATVSGVGASLFSAVAASNGAAAVAGVGESTHEGVGSTVGIAVVTGAIQAAWFVVGASSGTATVAGVGEADYEGVGASAGVAVVTGAGASLCDTVGVSAGAATVTGVGNSEAETVGASAGLATVIGRSTALGTGQTVDLTGFTAPSGDHTFVIGVDADNATNAVGEFLFDAQTGRLSLALLDANGNNNVSWFDGSWKEIAAGVAGDQILTWRFSGATGEIFRNTTSLGTDTYSAKAIGGTVAMGSSFSALDCFYSGDLFLFLYYNRALEDWEIFRNYHVARRLFAYRGVVLT